MNSSCDFFWAVESETARIYEVGSVSNDISSA